jgi:hypothetical protein
MAAHVNEILDKREGEKENDPTRRGYKGQFSQNKHYELVDRPHLHELSLE